MPLNQFLRNTCVGMNRINNTLNTSGNYGTGIVHTVTHGIAGTYLDGNLILIHQLHQFHAERNHIPVNIRSGNILQMTANTDTLIKALTDDAQIMIHCLLSGHLQLQENMIVGAAYQNTGFLHSDFFYQFKVFLAGTDPAGDLRELISPFHTLIHSISVLLTVKEELAGANHSVGTAQTMQIIENGYNLLSGIGCPGLLSVTEGSIRNKDILGHIMRNNTIIKRNLGNLGIRKHIPEHIRTIHIIQNVHMFFNLEKIRILIHGYRSILKHKILLLLPKSFHICSFRMIVYNYTIPVNSFLRFTIP